MTSAPMCLEKYASTPFSTATVSPRAQATGISLLTTRHTSRHRSERSPTLMARMDQRGGLTSRVAAHVHYGSYECRKHDDMREHLLLRRDEGRGHHAENGEKNQPEHADLEHGAERRLKNVQIRVVVRGRAAETCQLCGILFLFDVHGIVDGDDAEHGIVFVQHGKGQQIVSTDHFRGADTRPCGTDGDGMPVHDVFHGGVVVGQKQFPERYCAEQMFLPVEHIDDVDGLAGTCSGSDGSECRRDARFRQHGNIFGSRDRAGAFSGEGGQFENVVPGMFSEDGKNLLLQMRVQKRIKIRSFVGGQMFEQLRCLFNGHGMEEDGLERLGK